MAFGGRRRRVPDASADAAAEPGRRAGVGWAQVCDIFAMLPLVVAGRSRALTPADFNPTTPPTFTLAYGPPTAVADQIDEAAAKARAAQAIAVGKGQKPWPLLVQMALLERRALLAAGLAFGVVHGVINSVKRDDEEEKDQTSSQPVCRCVSYSGLAYSFKSVFYVIVS